MSAFAKTARLLIAAPLLLIPCLQRAAEPPAAQEAVSDGERTYRDFALPPAATAGDAIALRIRLASPLPRDKVRAVTIHLKSGNGWHGDDLGGATDAFCAGKAVRTALVDFQPEGAPGAIGAADTIRISAWKNADFDEPIVLAEAAFDAPARIAVLRPSGPANSAEYNHSDAMAGRCARLLEKAGLQYDFISSDCTALSGKGGKKPSRAYDLALLPDSAQPSADEIGRLKTFVEAGGKIIVFFNADKTLGKLLGVEPGPWRSTGSRSYAAIDATPLFGVRRRIPHFTDGVIPPRPIPGGEARKVATWVAAFDTPVQSPAVTLSPNGAWFAHVPPRAYQAAVDLIYTLATNLVPSLASEGTRNGERGTGNGEQLPNSQLSTFNPSTPQLTNSPTRLPGALCVAWVNTAELPVKDFVGLKSLGLDTLFMHWQTAHEHRRPFPAVGKPDTIEAQIASARDAGLTLHAWATCFTLDGVSAEERAKFEREKRLSKTNPNWLDPTLTKNHDLVIARLVEMAKRGVAGIHIDYARTDDTVPPSPEATAAITDFVRKASKAVRAANTNIVFSAAVFPTPEAAAHRNQDWPAWVREGLVDFVCPMIYTESPAGFRAQLASCLAVAPAAKIMPGIGTGADESQADAATAAAECAAAASAGCIGIAFFTLDDSLIEVLEALR